MTDESNRKIGAVLSYLSIIISMVIQLVYTPFLIKSLGQSEYGLFSLVNSLIGYLTVLDLGFGNAIVVYTTKYRALKKYDELKKLHGMFFVIFCIIAFIVGIMGFIIFLNIDSLFGKTMNSTELYKAKIMMVILTINLTLTFIFSIYSSILNAYEKFVFQKVLSLLNTILKPIIMIPLLLLGYKSISMVLIISFINLLILVANYMYCKNKLDISIKYSGFDKSIFKAIFSYSIWIFLGQIVDKANWSVDQFVLGAVSGTVAVSIYSVAATLNTLFLNLSTVLSGIFLPKITKMVTNNASSEELTNEMIRVGRLQYIVLFLACSGLVLFGKTFIIWWVGENYSISYYVAMILIIPLCFPLIQNIGLSILQAKNKFKFKSITSFIMAIANIFISIYFAKRYGTIGSAIGTALALIICNIFIMNIYYYKTMELNVLKFWKSIIWMTIPFILPIILIVIIMNIFGITGIKGVVIYGFLYTIMYLFVCYFFCLNKSEKEMIYSMYKKKGNEY